MMVMKRNKKIAIIICLSIGIIVGIAGIIYKFYVPQTVTEDETLYEYTFQPSLTYEVHLIQNNIYDSLIQKEDSVYLKNLMDYIQVKFDTNYKANEVVSLDMEYEIIASVVGYNSNEDNRMDYWTKNFPLSDKKTIHKNTDSLNNTENIKINLSKYDDFAKEANNLSGINLNTELVVKMVGNITADSSNGTLQTPIDIEATIPLQNNAIIITKGNTDMSSDKITNTVEKVLPVNTNHIIYIGVGIILCIVGIIISCICIRQPLQSEILRKEIRKLIKNYGSRMVALQCVPDKECNYYEVNSIKDLLVLSDEIQKPIYYIIDEEQIVKDYSFYVEDRHDIYRYISNRPNDEIIETDYVELQKEFHDNTEEFHNNIEEFSDNTEVNKDNTEVNNDNTEVNNDNTEVNNNNIEESAVTTDIHQVI